MGLMVKRGNPLRINSLADLAARKARFVNRDHDSGTRLLFNQLLALDGIDECRHQRRAADRIHPRRVWQPTWRATWRMRASASRQRHGSSGSTS